MTTINGNVKGLISYPLLPEELKNETQYLIKNKGLLYAGVNGTGRLYELTDSNGILKVIRRDSTFFTGSPFGGLPFSEGNSIYSFGGYGFGKFNGTLRQFNFSTKEWDALPLQKEIKGMFADHSWINTETNTLYLEDPLAQSEAFLPHPPQKLPAPELHTVNWKSGEVNTLGKLSYTPVHGIQTPWGKLVITVYGAELYDFKHNKILKANETLLQKMRELKNPRYHTFYFLQDSTLYYGDMDPDLLDSIPLSILAFKDSGGQIYHGQRTIVLPERYLLVFLLPLIVFITWMLIRLRTPMRPLEKDRRKTVKSTGEDTPNNNSEKALSPAFTFVEVEFLRFLVEKSKKKHPASVDEVNKLLGLSSKNEAVQKKNRSEVIALINQKWALTHGDEPPLIDRQRTDTDRRSFEYFLTPHWLNELMDWMS